MMPAQDRRQAERIVLPAPLPARLHDSEVRIVDIGPVGMRVLHERPLSIVAPARLRFRWGDDDIELDCTVARSTIDTADGINIFHTGLEFRAMIEPQAPLTRMLEQLHEREEIEHLKTLVEASKLINSSIEPDALFASILGVARAELGVERGTLYFVDERAGQIWSKVAGDLELLEIRLPIGKGIAGTVAATGEHVVLHDAYADDRFDQSMDRASGFRTRSMLCAPIKNRSGRVVGVLQLLNKVHGSFGQADLRFLDAISDHMAIAMENATMHLELVEKQRMAQELNLGREIQNRLLPSPPSDLKGVELAAMNICCYEVGGDYYDFLELPGGDLGVVIADVSGKGVSAALIMSSIQAALRVAAPIESDLAMLVARLNALIYRSATGHKYVTAFVGRYTPSSGELRYVNAGHNPPMVVREGIGGPTVERLDSTGKPIGILPDSPFAEASITLQPGSTLFLFTDGLNEAENAAEEQFGDARLVELVREASSSPVGQMSERILAAITSFENGAAATDDKTLVIVRRV
jgi:sigma-B regulation protein RsbU (phosphoserine phosphatase)